ncbi:MAG: efflux RND transporter periplasmic adaptor subunit [Akkermansiaceae bacterium]|jgi:RND family efflux transporter MFP subunit|nr:efflux RND transporter periplasmic adaptor subunit [Akkermansiaceae bacterium]
MRLKHLSLMALGAWLAAACNRHAPEATRAASLPAAEVQVAAAERQSLTLTEDITGTVRAKTRAVMEAKVSGRITAMDIVLGQEVKAGEVLATLDDRELRARRESAEATLAQATADERRLAGLLATTAISRADYDAAKARMEVAKAALTEAQTLLDHTRITAPFDGLITRKLADQGDLAAPGKPLLEIEKPDHLQIVADIPEALIGKLRQGMNLPVDIGGASHQATLAEISPAGDPNSRTFPVKLDLPSGAALRPGQFVRVAVPVRDYEALLIPTAALVTRGQMEMVFINEDGHARLRLVRSGGARDGTVEILAGLDDGESLVVAGAAALRDGQPLLLKP